MRFAERVVAVTCVAAALLGGCDRLRARGADAGAADAGPPGPTTVQVQPAGEAWQLVGTLSPGASVRTGAVLLLHQLGSDRGEWAPLVARLQLPPAITVLTLDLRGHGESVQGPRSAHETWEGFGEDPARWAGLSRDALAGAAYLHSGGFRAVVAVGSSIGASAAVAGLADVDDVRGLAMISPGVAYHGLDALAPMRAFAARPSLPDAAPRTAWMIAAAGDAESARALPMLVTEGAGIAVERVVVPGTDAHGVSLLNADPARWDALARYVRATLRAARGPVRALPDGGARP